MKIDLSYIIARKKDTLANFLKKNNLLSYKQLLKFCSERSINPCSEKEFKENMQLNEKVTKELDVKEVKKEQAENQPKTRKSSKAQKKKSTRNSSKRKQVAQKLSNSADSKKS